MIKTKQVKSTSNPIKPLINNNNNNNNQKNEIDHSFQTKTYESFWKLSQFNAQLRMEGIQMICDQFNTSQSDYILNRLVKGLASNRKCSRLGFSCALTELFNMHASLTFDQVINVAKKNFSFNLDDCTKSLFNHSSNVLTKEELRHMQIGLVFIYLAYIQSNRLDNNNNNNENIKLIVSIATSLNQIRKNKEIKTYVQELYLQALIQLIKKLANNNEQLFVKHLYPVIERDLNDLFKSTLILSDSKNDLNLLLACLNSYSTQMKTLLKQHDLNVLFSHENYTPLYDIISQSTELLPNVQPFCIELFKYLVSQKPLIAKEFWSHVIDMKLVTRKEHEKKYLSFKLFLIYLSYVNESNYKIIFEECLLTSDNLIQTLVNNYCNKLGQLNKICKDIMKELVDVIRLKEKQFSAFSKSASRLIIKFTWFARNYHDLSDLLSTMILALNKYGLEELFDYLTDDFPRINEAARVKENSTNVNETVNEKSPTDQLVIKYMWIANQLFNMSKNVDLFQNDQLVKKILSFLVAFSYFNVSPNADRNANNKIESYIILNDDFIHIKIENNEKLENCYRDTLLKNIGVLLTNNDSNSNKKIIDLIKYTQSLMKSKDESIMNDGYKIKKNVQMVSKLNDYDQLSTKIIKMLNMLNQLSITQNGSIEHKEAKSTVQTFFIVTTLEFFRMFDSIKNSQRTINDIEICFEQFNSKDKNNNDKISDDDALNWIDVLVEMLLNLLTINKNFIRLIVKNEFKKLFPILTFDSVKLIVDLLDIENESLEETNEDGESDLESDDDDDDNTEEKTTQNGHEESVNSESSDDDKEEEEMMQLDENLKFNLEKISNGNGVDGDESDEFGSDLDDDTMLKMDETYAKAFKLRKQEKSTISFKIDYKLRVLDLIQELFKSNTRLDIVNYLIQPMLNILFESQKKPNLKSISQRILGFLVNFKQCLSKINDSKLPEVDDLFQTLTFILDCSTKHFNVINTLLESSMFCVKIILNIANSSNESDNKKKQLVEKLTNVYIEAIKSEKTKINPLMYKGFISRYPEYSIPLVIQIIDSANITEVRVHKKIFALMTLSQTINNQMLAKKNEDKLDLLNRKIFTFIDQILSEINKTEDLNIKYFDAVLTLTNKVLNLQKNFLKKESCENLASKLNLFMNEAKVKQTYKSRINKLIQLCELIFKNNSIK